MELLIVFTDYYFATKAEKVLKAADIKLQLIPTPAVLHHACGLCILCAKDDLVRVLAVLKEARVSHSGVYEYDRAAKKCSKLTVL
ncbi:DUF3343 domain-containing protein [Veillonella criceti]|uniref:Protein of uncharacterized function (DUF3343) n=1 Tax=Veillonella criceti TaxID=103891 RepID=A0A380NMP9_9FIRM|nr:DUF3343 domain-containing protein [Veillonella criceti]SUP43660.1 Protein of uncharacterised function (DUF3343) [Veillonella criceti]